MTTRSSPGPAAAAHPGLDAALLDALTSAVLRRIRIARLAAHSGEAGSARIEKVEFTNVGVEKADIENLTTKVKCGAALLRNVRLILELHYEVGWSYDLKWLGSDSGTKTLGSTAKPIPLHDFRIPVLQDIALQIPQATVTDIQADVDSVADLDLGGVAFEGLELNNTRLPSDGFSITGLSFGSFELESFGVPGSDSDDVRIERFAPTKPVKLPTLTVRDIETPAVGIDDVVSDGAVSLMDIQTEVFEAPVFKIGDFFKVKFVTTPVLHLQIGELVLTELEGSAAIGSVAVSGVSAELAALGVGLDRLHLDSLTIDDVRA